MGLYLRAFLVAVALSACGAPSVGELQQEVKVCADGTTVQGIDVSYYQGTIDWDTVAASGIKFAFIRVSHGTHTIDTEFDRNWSEAKRVGIIRGVYQFYDSANPTTDQAQLLLDKMGTLDPGDLPPVLDVEQAGSLTPTELIAEIHVWLDYVSAATARKPIIYTAPAFWNNTVGSPADFTDHPLWIANYGTSCPTMADPWTRWDFWQKSQTGSVNGISVAVDLDEFNGDLATLQGFSATTQLCGDGRCLPSETAASCAADCGSCVLPHDGGEIDDSSACFTMVGRPASWRTDPSGIDNLLHWTYAWDQPDENIGTWTFELTDAGRYHVEVHTPAPFGGTHMASYHVRHAGTDEQVVIDQSAVDGWQVLGDWDFAAGGDQRIWLGDSTGDPLADKKQIVFDAVRLTLVGDSNAPDGGTDDMGGAGDDMGGPPIVADQKGCACSITQRPTAMPWACLCAVALLALWRPRRAR